jgi:excisionase family DNA binding protein
VNAHSRQEANSDLVLTVPQAAALLQVSENHVYNLIGQDALPHMRVGKLIRIPRWGLMQFIAAEAGIPLPSSLEVAFDSDQSVHGQHPVRAEGPDGER